MPEFILDTSGRPRVAPTPNFPNGVSVKWDDLDAFTQGYIEALFFTENDPGLSRHDSEFVKRGPYPDEGAKRTRYWRRVQEGQRKEIPGDYGFADLAPATLARIVTDCHEFQQANAANLAKAYGHEFPARTIGDGTLPGSHLPAWDYDETAAGRDYWYTRNGHGVGFWDRGLGEAGDALTEAAQYSTVDVGLDTDGRVVF